MHRVFVYGTLKRGFPNFDAGMKGQRFIGRARTRDAYPLVVAGNWFSPILLYEPGVGRHVFGEAFEVSDQALAVLDRMEGTHLPNGYDRRKVSVESVDGGAVSDAWTYFKERARLDVIHTDGLDDYALDPRYVPPSERKPE